MTKLEECAMRNSERIGALEKLRLVVYGMGLAMAPTFAVLGFLWAHRQSIAAVLAVAGSPRP